MRLVKISFSLPEFILYIPLLILGYLLTGLIIGLTQSLWVASFAIAIVATLFIPLILIWQQGIEPLVDKHSASIE